MTPTIQTCTYRKTLPRAIVTAHGSYDTREGAIIRLSDGTGQYGLGDAAPLPGFSRDSFAQMCLALDGLAQHAANEELADLVRLCETMYDLPALAFAVGAAIEDLNARRRGLPLCRSLAADAAARIPINGLIGDGDATGAREQVLELWASEYRVFKVKVAAGSPERDIERILAIIHAVPEAKLRLDANAGWKMEQVHEVMKQIPVENLDFLEQPLSIGRIQESRRLCHDHGVRLALDEDVSTFDQAHSIISERACDVVVLKPMVLGSFRASYLLAQAALAQKMEVIYTSVWESDIGIAATLHLAAALGPNPSAMGLSTAGMIADGIVEKPLRIENGFLKVPEGPGLGMELAPELLERLK